MRARCLPGRLAIQRRKDSGHVGHEIKSVADSYMDYGAGQIIVRTDVGYTAGSDPRRDGQAAGF